MPIQRKSALLQYLSLQSSVTTKELSEKFAVSKMTIHRDLLELEQQGLVKRSHGGAVSVNVLLEEPALQEKIERNQDIKERLARYAAEQFIGEGDVIILEGGTTAAKMVPYLVKPDLTVVTNGLDVLTQLKTAANRLTVLCSGGILREASGTFVGPVAESFFTQFHAKTVFLSALSFSEEIGFTDPNLMDTQVKKSMIQSGAKIVMMLDSSKYGTRSFATVARLDEISVLVTDDGIPEQIREACDKAGVELHIV
ncbi:DeoR/GlpR family DNA-binding transcription regulator [Paenibacillus sp. CF384]|uniref:DeoR/GlpR family DNA-binding transcription regulator n=1 Tax=Paenibacillus sp. CF384 TaxID=1884382 RepID=UPI00115F997B|nr:DeoR/GlpR family DNA-binding transcription regulator [Paenibacillus sp. CF384]